MFIKILINVFCDSEGIRTPNPQSRNLIFYPVELRSLKINGVTYRACLKTIRTVIQKFKVLVYF